jgi:hypothetical protein
MALRFAVEPQNGKALVQAGLTRVLRRPQAPPAAMRAATLANMQVQPPHAIYDLRADEIAAGGGLETARRTGFRYLVESAQATVAAAEVNTDASGAASLLAHVNFGPYVEATARALTVLPTLGQVSAATFEARLLRFAAVGVMAIWLKPDAAGQDLIYPLAPTPKGLQAEVLCSPADFLAAVRPLAQKRATAPGPKTP